MSQKTKWYSLVSVLTIFLLLPLKVLAVQYQDIGGKPAYPDPNNPKTQSIFIHTLGPGETKEDGVLIVNDTAEEKTLLVYGADSSFASGGSFACKQIGEESKLAGSWINLEKTEVTLGPVESEVVPFTITVPQGVEAGEYNACIGIQEKKPPQEQEGGIRLTTRLAIRVAITVPGELIKELEISDFVLSANPTGGYFTTPYVTNTGNVSVDADLKISTRYIFGLKLKEINSKRTIFRGETASWNYELEQPLLGGWYRTTLVVGYSGAIGNELLKGPTITFFSLPTTTGWIINISILLVLLISILLFWLSRRRKKWIKTDWVDHEIQPNENLEILAKKFDVSWKLLVGVNKLKPPYALKAGERIKVPPEK